MKTLKLLGVIMTYNDADCLHGAIECLLEGHDAVYVFDHGSTDNTREIVAKYPKVFYENVNRIDWPNFMVPGTNNIHYKITSFINSQKPNFDWVTWIDSDEVLTSSNPDMSLREEIEQAHAGGFDCLDATLYEYWMTEDDDPSIQDFRDRIKHYENKGRGYCGGINRTWKISFTPRMTEGTLRHTFFHGRNMSPSHLILKHYPIRTSEQGYKKINEDRQIHEGAGNHYKGAGLGDRKDLARGKNWGTKDA